MVSQSQDTQPPTRCAATLYRGRIFFAFGFQFGCPTRHAAQASAVCLETVFFTGSRIVLAINFEHTGATVAAASITTKSNHIAGTVTNATLCRFKRLP
jgi:hypothetical protein